MISVRVVGVAALNHRHGHALEPDIIADQGRGVGGIVEVVFRNTVPFEIINIVDRLRQLRQTADRVLTRSVALVLRL